MPSEGSRKLFLTVLTMLALIVAGWLGLGFRVKSKYDQVRKQTQLTYAVTSMDQQSSALLAELESDWICKVDETNGSDAEIVKLTGMTPSVRNLISALNYEMPAYQWFSASRNRKSLELGLAKLTFFPDSLDRQWHLSEDSKLAVLRLKTNAVFVYRDEAGGLRATLYVRQKTR